MVRLYLSPFFTGGRFLGGDLGKHFDTPKSGSKKPVVFVLFDRQETKMLRQVKKYGSIQVVLG